MPYIQTVILLNYGLMVIVARNLNVPTVHVKGTLQAAVGPRHYCRRSPPPSSHHKKDMGSTKVYAFVGKISNSFVKFSAVTGSEVEMGTKAKAEVCEHGNVQLVVIIAGNVR